MLKKFKLVISTFFTCYKNYFVPKAIYKFYKKQANYK